MLDAEQRLKYVARLRNRVDVGFDLVTVSSDRDQMVEYRCPRVVCLSAMRGVTSGRISELQSVGRHDLCFGALTILGDRAVVHSAHDLYNEAALKLGWQ